MHQTPEAEAFLNRILSLPTGPGVSLDEALQPSLDDEAELRKLFATDKTNARLSDPLVGLVDVFDAPVDIRTTRARVIKDDQDLSNKYIMPLSDANRRKEGTSSMSADLEEFKKNWAIFTEGSLSQLLDWNNVVAAGGAVLACLSSLSDATKESKRSIRKYFHSTAYPTSDVDLFLWGMDAEQAEKKIIQIYEAVRDSVPWDVTCVRTKHTVSIYSQFPYRSVQIVLRLYSSPAEIMAGFDIDAPCCLYNGQRVLANPRAIVAMMRQANTVDMTRRSPSYEVRLTKYSSRAFEVKVPTLERDNIDPTIYERSIARIEGLARLLVLEKLADTAVRYNFLESRRILRGRPNPLHRYSRRRNKYKGDLKADISIGGLEMNDYNVATLHIPYGPGWTARRIDKLVYQTDLGMNSTFNPKNKDRRLHRHPAFFGTMEECIEDCCEHCPDPIDDDESKLQEDEDKTLVRGRIAFIEEDPGRQSMSGSFNPIDVGEWSAQVYIGEIEHFFAAVVAQDREVISNMIKGGFDVNRRDHVGRTPLHLAIITCATDIACDLIEGNARITARLVDGRSALHLAAQYEQPVVIRKLFEKSASNQAAGEVSPEVPEKMDVEAPGLERPSSDDDWTSEDDALGVVAMDTDVEDDTEVEGGDGDNSGELEGGDDAGDEDMNDDNDDNDDDDEYVAKDGDGVQPEKPEGQEFPEDATDQPDILEVNLPDWDLGFTPLAHAILSGSVESVEELLKEGADPALVNTSRDKALHPLSLTILLEDENEASKILEKLILSGASTSAADENFRTIFHRAVISDKIKLVSTILKCDPNGDTVLNFPSLSWNVVTYPIVSAIDRRHYSMLATLLAHGAKLVITAEDVNVAMHTIPQKQLQNYFRQGKPFDGVFLPLETAISKFDDIAQFLLSLDIDVNVGLFDSRGDNIDPTRRKTILDWVQFGIAFLSKRVVLPQSIEASNNNDSDTLTGWKKFYADLLRENVAKAEEMNGPRTVVDSNERLRRHDTSLSYLVDMERLLLDRGAKTWNELYPESPSIAPPDHAQQNAGGQVTAISYSLLGRYYYANHAIPENLGSRYDELYEACFTGDNRKVESLCLPQEEFPDIFTTNIFVQMADKKHSYNQTGHTPLFAAICGRQWATARLILAIAVAQYQPPENTNKFSMKGMVLYDEDDSDNDSEASGESGATASPGQEEIRFIDIAKRPSSIETDVHPKRMLDESQLTWYTKDTEGKYVSKTENLLLKTILDNDLEAFVNVFSLYITSPIPIPLQATVLATIVREDRAEMLDSYIRKTGQGIEISDDIVDPAVIATNDKNKMYLGLTVHGKKRADLAEKSDPNAVQSPTTYPLVWMAAQNGAKLVVEYLSENRPLKAYRHYMTSSGDEHAYQMRRIRDLEKILPERLGWTVINLGDSPLMAAITGRDVDLLKIMFAKKPKFMATCLHESIKFSGYNAVLLAAHMGCKPDMFDYLLAKSVSPAVNDTTRGWNLYHILCRKGHSDVIEHLLNKLPRDVNEALLAQQSKGRLNTPLHLAVKEGWKRATSLIVNFSKAGLLIRDIDGSIPLHCAVQREYAAITSTLIEETPSDGFHMENGVGETPLDIARLKYTLMITGNFSHEHYSNPHSLGVGDVSRTPCRVDLNGLEPELQRLRVTIEQLVRDGKVAQDARLVTGLTRFAELMEEKVLVEKSINNDTPVAAVELAPTDQRDSNDARRSLNVVAAALAGSPGKRQLVHLVDVQKSVQSNLSRFASRQDTLEAQDDGEGLGLEEDEEIKDRQKSFVMAHILDSVQPDFH